MKAVVYGLPVPMGSKNAFKGRVVDSNAKKLRPFQALMRDAMAQDAPESPLTGPIEMRMVFYLPRPRNHFGTGKNADVLKASAPSVPTVKPDVDKLVRAVLDCGTGLWFKDDAQVVASTEYKRYGERPRVEVECVPFDACHRGCA